MRISVVGAGAIGKNHARIYADLPDVELVGIVDRDLAVAQNVAARYGTRAYADLTQLLEHEAPQAVSIAVPTVDHLDVALQVIETGAAVLVEKPIASSVEAGRQMLDAARRAGVLLMIGHVERFNPAVSALKSRLAAGELGQIFQIDSRRQGPFPSRVKDVGVVIDLAVHDLDLMRYVTASEIVRVYAETEQRIHSQREDLLVGLVRLSEGAVGTLTVNWLTPTKIRELYVTGERGMFRVDYLTQDLYFFENAGASSGQWETLQILRGVSEGRMIRHIVAKKEPLRAELEAFVAAARGEIEPPVSGEDGLRALELAYAFMHSSKMHQPIAVA